MMPRTFEKRVKMYADQVTAIERLQPMLCPAGSWAFRMPGSPMSWNHALIRRGFGRPFLSPAAREWKHAVAIYALRNKPKEWPMDARYRVEVHSHFTNPRSDADGPVKLALDALNGVAWRDDALVVEVVARKSVDAVAPRLEILISVVLA